MTRQSANCSKNIFDFATKELSQDAFLRWLIESASDPDVAPVSQAFLKWLTGRDGKVKVIRTVAQWHRIDVVAELYYPAAKESVLLAIEDKVNSGEHDNQLKRYNDQLKRWSFDKSKKGEKTPVKVYYKTSLFDESGDEQRRVEEAGWTIKDLKSIVGFFHNYITYGGSVIVCQYAAHVLRRKKDAKEISNKPMTEWGLVNFQTWFREKLRAEVIKVLPNLNLEGKVYQGHYFSFYATRPYADKTDRSVCLEIIFRPEDENGVAGVLYPRKDGGTGWLPDGAWEVSKDYRNELIQIVEAQAQKEWSFFVKPRRNATVRIGSFRETISLDGETQGTIIAKLIGVLEEFYWLFDVNRCSKLPQCRRASDLACWNSKVVEGKSKQKAKRLPGKGPGKASTSSPNKTSEKHLLDALHKMADYMNAKSADEHNITIQRCSDVGKLLLRFTKRRPHVVFNFWVQDKAAFSGRYGLELQQWGSRNGLRVFLGQGNSPGCGVQFKPCKTVDLRNVDAASLNHMGSQIATKICQVTGK